MKSVTTEIAIMNFDEAEAILHIEMVSGAEMTLENTIEHYRIIKRLTANKEYAALINAANYFAIDKEALKYGSLQNAIGKRTASAHYNISDANRLTVNFFKTQYKPQIPVGSFKSKAEALLWLKAVQVPQETH
ncbi:MAG: hypothetical protein JWO32_544 [Bacteroidetes bacterium]|nr:hypothetical protein [Bacteroidota bacterium]